jgi:hypothetical protein
LLSASALALTIVVTVFVGPFSLVSLVACMIATIGIVIGVTRQMQQLTALSVLVLFAGVVIAGVRGTPVYVLLPSVTATILAGEFANAAFAARMELRGGTTAYSEPLHVVMSVVAGGMVATLAYIAYTILSFRVSPVAVVLLAIAAATLGFALRR